MHLRYAVLANENMLCVHLCCQAAGEVDAVLQRGVLEGSLKVVESGNDLPVIDLSQVR
jgi:hypothetical protein